ncbi:hypothetical protein ACFVP0_24535 [Streptomyces cinereoruber]|uniref:hypothetical protein n=1 Tax=Streptomyces cinereoruber TaxID=67260 RepID=UPI0036B9F383
MVRTAHRVGRNSVAIGIENEGARMTEQPPAARSLGSTAPVPLPRRPVNLPGDRSGDPAAGAGALKEYLPAELLDPVPARRARADRRRATS